MNYTQDRGKLASPRALAGSVLESAWSTIVSGSNKGPGLIRWLNETVVVVARFGLSLCYWVACDQENLVDMISQTRMERRILSQSYCSLHFGSIKYIQVVQVQCNGFAD